MRELHTQDWGRIIHRVYASACRAIMLRRRCGGLNQITVKSPKIPRDAMHAHILASPSSADELTKHLTELNGFRSVKLDDAGKDGGIQEEFGAEVPRQLQRRVVELGDEKFGARRSREAGVWWSGSC